MNYGVHCQLTNLNKIQILFNSGFFKFSGNPIMISFTVLCFNLNFFILHHLQTMFLQLLNLKS